MTESNKSPQLLADAAPVLETGTRDLGGFSIHWARRGQYQYELTLSPTPRTSHNGIYHLAHGEQVYALNPRGVMLQIRLDTKGANHGALGRLTVVIDKQEWPLNY